MHEIQRAGFEPAQAVEKCRKRFVGGTCSAFPLCIPPEGGTYLLLLIVLIVSTGTPV